MPIAEDARALRCRAVGDKTYLLHVKMCRLLLAAVALLPHPAASNAYLAPPDTDFFPEITLEGEQTQLFGTLPEPYMDPGYECYNPGSCYVGTDCPEGKIDVDVKGTVDLSKCVSFALPFDDQSCGAVATRPSPGPADVTGPGAWRSHSVSAIHQSRAP